MEINNSFPRHLKRCLETGADPIVSIGFLAACCNEANGPGYESVNCDIHPIFISCSKVSSSYVKKNNSI